MRERKPCMWCGKPKPRRKGVRVCGGCTVAEAIWPKLTPGPGDCWIWPGPLCEAGYGRHNGQLVHRITYEALIADIPDGLTIDHLCGVTACANPWHLEPVTLFENLSRRGRQITQCVKGHEFTSENTIRRGRFRQCRECGRAASRAYYRRKKVSTT